MINYKVCCFRNQGTQITNHYGNLLFFGFLALHLLMHLYCIAVLIISVLLHVTTSYRPLLTGDVMLLNNLLEGKFYWTQESGCFRSCHIIPGQSYNMRDLMSYDTPKQLHLQVWRLLSTSQECTLNGYVYLWWHGNVVETHNLVVLL